MSYSKRKNSKKQLDKNIIFDEYIESLYDINVTNSVRANSGLYDILNISPNSSPKSIREAYKKLLFKYHPDKGGTTELFIKIQRAFDILSNPETRCIYDDYGENSVYLYLQLNSFN